MPCCTRLHRIFFCFATTQPVASAIKEGDEVRYRSGGGAGAVPATPEKGTTEEGDGAKAGEGAGAEAKEERAIVVKVHPDAEGVHYTIRTLGKDGKEKNTTAEHISKVFALADLGTSKNLVDALFGLEMVDEFKCEESGESKVRECV